MRLFELLAAEIGPACWERVDQRDGVAGAAEHHGRERAGKARAYNGDVGLAHEKTPQNRSRKLVPYAFGGFTAPGVPTRHGERSVAAVGPPVCRSASPTTIAQAIATLSERRPDRIGIARRVSAAAGTPAGTPAAPPPNRRTSFS